MGMRIPNICLLRNMVIKGPIFYEADKQRAYFTAVEFVLNIPSRFPPKMNFFIEGAWASSLVKNFKEADGFEAVAIARPYIGRVYGKRKKPIKYPNGKFRRTAKVQFEILLIRKSYPGINKETFLSIINNYSW